MKRSKENDEWINSQQRNLLQDSLQDPSAITLGQIKAICSLEKIIESEPKESVFGEILKFLLLKSRARYSFPMAKRDFFSSLFSSRLFSWQQVPFSGVVSVFEVVVSSKFTFVLVFIDLIPFIYNEN